MDLRSVKKSALIATGIGVSTTLGANVDGTLDGVISLLYFFISFIVSFFLWILIEWKIISKVKTSD